MMYGNWRGQISINLDEYFNNTKENNIIEDLKLMKDVPSPEKRAALFSYLQYSTEIFEKFKKYFMWGVTDPHPWVRRDEYSHAVKLYFFK